jgi:hypothetical protein
MDQPRRNKEERAARKSRGSTQDVREDAAAKCVGGVASMASRVIMMSQCSVDREGMTWSVRGTEDVFMRDVSGVVEGWDLR